MINLTILLNEQTGELQVHGPVQNKILCYGLLEMARDVVKEFKGGGIIVPANGMLPPNGSG